MNYVKDVCTKVLGLDWKDNKSSKFTINVKGENPIKHCYIDESGYLYDDEGIIILSLVAILNGSCSIEKEPKVVPFYDCPIDEQYHYVPKDVCGNIYMHSTYTDNSIFELMCKKTHNMFATRDLSKEQMKDVIKSLKEN